MVHPMDPNALLDDNVETFQGGERQGSSSRHREAETRNLGKHQGFRIAFTTTRPLDITPFLTAKRKSAIPISRASLISKMPFSVPWSSMCVIVVCWVKRRLSKNSFHIKGLWMCWKKERLKNSENQCGFIWRITLQGYLIKCS